MRRAQPYRIEWPLTASGVANIDEMFQTLFDDLGNGTLEVALSQITSVTPGDSGTLFTVGDLIYAATTASLDVLESVSAGSYLRSAGTSTIPVWSTVKLPNTATTGDLWYASATNTLAALADVATGQVLASGGVGVAPAWSASPTLTTSLTTPLVIGGTAVSSTLSLRSTSGVGTSDAIIFQVGSNGATEAMRITTGGLVGIGTNSPTAGSKVDIKGSGNGRVLIGEWASDNRYGGISFNGSLAAGSYSIISAPGFDGNLYFNVTSGAHGFYFRENNSGTHQVAILDGKVGVGVAPTDWIHIEKDSATPAAVQFKVKNTNASGDVRMLLENSSGGSIAAQVTGSSYANPNFGAFFSQGNMNLGFFTDGDVASGGTATMAFHTGGYTVATQERMRISAAGLIGIGTTGPDRLLHVELSDATTNAVTYPLRLTHLTTGTPATGIGAGLEFEAETAANNHEVGATIEAVTTDVTSTSEDFDLVFKLMAAGAAAAERVRVTSVGRVGVGVSPTAYLHLPAGSTAASSAPLKFTTGTSMTSAEAGAMEYTTDDLFFTISTGTARKRLLMADPVGGLTSGRVPFATTNGRLTDISTLTYESSLLTAGGSSTPTGGFSTASVYLSRSDIFASNNGRLERVLVAETGDATPTEMFTDAGPGSGATNRIAVASDGAIGCILHVCVKQNSSANAYFMMRQFVISNDGGTTALQGSVATLGTDSGSAALSGVVVAVTADNTNDCIAVTVTGLAATTLSWTAYLLVTAAGDTFA